MQHSLACRSHRNSNLHLVSDPNGPQRLSSQPPPQFALRSRSLSSVNLKWRHGLVPFGSFKALPRLQFKPMRVAGAAFVNAPGNEDTHSERVPREKVIRIVLLAATVVGVTVLLKAGSALASSQLVIPSIARTPAVTQSGRELLVSAWMGLMAGCLHTLTGPDHLAALAPLSIGRTKLESVAVGALWGCGHDAGQVIFGLLFLLLKDKLQIELLRTWGARVVGMTLLAIGITGMKEAQEAAMVPCLAGSSSGLSANGLSHMEPVISAKRNTGFATFATGIVHGLQPDSLIMILPALALPSRVAHLLVRRVWVSGVCISSFEVSKYSD
ncbi:hypothetical protein L7F22_050370 [Adiantum nelumboides]|nr:hypothetical protein [Adiantum nelumboides]